MNFIIIGGDAAGMSAASRAKRINPEMDVRVFEKTMDVSYSACGMPYNIADPDRDIDDLVVRKADAFKEKQGIDLMTGYEVDTIDRINRQVIGTISTGASFQARYDKLLIATGASPIKPDIAGADLPGVVSLKSLADGRRIKSYLKENNVRRAVIIGLGYIGMEMCEAFHARGINVSMIGLELVPGLNPELAQIVQKEIEANGVSLHMGTPVSKIERKGTALCVVSGDQSVEGDMVLLGIGVQPNSALASQAGLDLGPKNAIAVNEYLQTSDDNIYSAGDCADSFHVVTHEKTWLPLGLRANRAGWTAADNVCGKVEKISPVAGTEVFKIFNLQVAKTGLNVAEAARHGFDPADAIIESPSRAHSYPGGSSIWVHMVGDKKSSHLLGVQMVGREGVAHRINAAAVALHNRMTVREFSRTDLAYAPPFSPVWDPMLTAALQLEKKLSS